ncbi:c-type cytochrome [uncultured Psychrobacter sp.]|uniref:c-type cytochrome n=1 Tax=uncultured Psychrobacter sp. TaxID=259303 RepID=UPI00260B1F6F|nr:c-type cytochrome [uncultured Psychrobacter sp.]
MIKKLTLSAFGIGTLLLLSACSGDNTTAEEPTTVNESTETSMAVEEAPITDPEASETVTSETMTSEPVVEAEPIEVAMAEEVEQKTAAEPEVLAADAGAKLYDSNCKVCHEAGLLDAPKYGDKAAWAPRLAKGIETLHMHSAQGFNKMPAQATDKVSEAEVYAAVDYMVEAVN